MPLIKSLAMIIIAVAIVFHALVPRYEVTVNDPTTWTEPWTFVLPWRSDDQYQLPEHIYEFACHEGNYRMMEGTLRGSRTLLEQTQ